MSSSSHARAVLLTAPNHTADLLPQVEAASDPVGRLRAYEAEFSFDRSSGAPRLWSVNRRRARRFAAEPGDALLTGDLELPVRDLSVRGVGLREPWAGPEGAEAVELRLGGARFRGRARPAARSAGRGLDLELEGDPIHLARRLLRRSSPRWRFRAEVPAEELTRLMEASGYLGLRAGNPLDADWLSPPSERLGMDVVWMDDAGERAIAHISSARAYRRTWVTHQLASLSDHPERLDGRLACYRFLSAAPTLVDDDAAYKIAYVNRSKKWHRVLCEDFVRWMNAPEHAIMTAWDRWEPEGPPRRRPPAADARIGPLDDVGRAWLISHLAQSLPSLTRRALDLDGDELTAEHLHPAYAEEGVERGRRAVVARERGRVVGAALVEISSPHLSIFNLFNLAQFFFDPSATPELRASLLNHVAGIYAARGIDNPMLVSPPGALAGCEDGSYRLAETMGLMAWSAAGLRQYENFIEYNFGRHRAAADRARKDAS